MPHDIRKLCFDILKAISEISEFIKPLNFDQYRENRLLKLAVEREYEIIGETLRRMELRFNDNFQKITEGRKIIDFRNILSHGYDSVSNEIFGA
ncbi:MAG: HepT-like ribonuclease domain-containing protein [Pyrinomonadaceae bacterium]